MILYHESNHKSMKLIITVNNWKVINSSIWKYISELSDWEYIIDIKKPTRTEKQNSLYWSILDYVYEQTWIDKDELHLLFKQKFLSKPVLTCFGDINITQSTKELDKDEFNNFITQVTLFLSENEINLPTYII